MVDLFPGVKIPAKVALRNHAMLVSITANIREVMLLPNLNQHITGFSDDAATLPIGIDVHPPSSFAGSHACFLRG
jgi:hypothetical protein